jgi:integrase
METVKYRTVSINVYPVTIDGKESWRFETTENGKRKYVTRSTLTKAKKEALDSAVTTFRGGVDISKLSQVEAEAVQRLLKLGLTRALADDIIAWHDKKFSKILLGVAIDEFLDAKRVTQGDSRENVRTLTSHLKLLNPLRDKMLNSILAKDLKDQFRPNHQPRTRNNIASSWRTFFNWCENAEYLPHGEKTAADRIEKSIVPVEVPTTYTPEELRTILTHASENYLPWVALAAFAGIRTAEIYPLPNSDKIPLDWSDFKWEQGIIKIKPRTSKVKKGRPIPINAALRSWLEPIMKKSGRVGTLTIPSSGVDPETARLGNLVGGWKQNALRHSFISNRGAQIGLALTAREAGNSEAQCAKYYDDAKTEKEAAEWFAVTR